MKRQEERPESTLNRSQVCIVIELELYITWTYVYTVKKKLENMAGGVEVESEAGGVRSEDVHPDDSDDVIGPPLPPGFKVRGSSTVEGQGHTLNYHVRILRLVPVALMVTTVRRRGKGRSQMRRKKK